MRWPQLFLCFNSIYIYCFLCRFTSCLHAIIELNQEMRALTSSGGDGGTASLPTVDLCPLKALNSAPGAALNGISNASQPLCRHLTFHQLHMARNKSTNAPSRLRCIRHFQVIQINIITIFPGARSLQHTVFSPPRLMRPTRRLRVERLIQGATRLMARTAKHTNRAKRRAKRKTAKANDNEQCDRGKRIAEWMRRKRKKKK